MVTISEIIFSVFMFALGYLAAYLITSDSSFNDGYDDALEQIKDELVESDHAEYYLDKNNNRQWRMKGTV